MMTSSMMMYAALIVSCLLLPLSTATNVTLCGGDENAVVNVSNCEEPPCMLKKNTTIQMQIEMTPDEDVEEIYNSVHANMGEERIFAGVDKTEVCPKLYMPDESQALCPLKKGQKYVYKDEFFIFRIYPEVLMTVSWKLKTPEGKVIACFEVEAKIID